MTNECIPAYRPGADVPAIAAAGGVTGKTFVDLTAALNMATGTPITVGTAPVAGLTIGVASRNTSAGDKLHILAGPGMVVPVTAGGTIAAGAEVEVGAGGTAVARTSGKARGRAWYAATTGADVLVELY